MSKELEIGIAIFAILSMCWSCIKTVYYAGQKRKPIQMRTVILDEFLNAVIVVGLYALITSITVPLFVGIGVWFTIIISILQMLAEPSLLGKPAMVFTDKAVVYTLLLYSVVIACIAYAVVTKL